MSLSLYDVSVGSYIQIVEATSRFLQKGAEHFAAAGTDADDVVSKRLHPDMFDFHFQVVCVTHHSLGAIEGIKTGVFSPPSYPQYGYADLQKLTNETLATLKGLSTDEVNALAGNRLVFKLGGNEIPFTAENFVLSFSLPNFYFHATTAYDILRMQGVPVGKRDFIGALKMG